ncbi:transposase [Roseomonas sp. GCM10028921]
MASRSRLGARPLTLQPATGASFALVLPRVSTGTMQLFLDRFSPTLAPDEHAAMVVDGAGWHIARDLRIPGNITLVLLPPYSPELNPVERVWLFLGERHLSHRLLAGYDAIVDALCAAWNALSPERLLSLTRYPYLNQVSF